MDAVELIQKQIAELVKRVDNGEQSPFTVKLSMPEYVTISQFLHDEPDGVSHLVPPSLMFTEVKYEVVY